MAKTLFDTQIDILLELGSGLKCGLTKRQLNCFFQGKEDMVLKNGIALVSYGETSDTKDEQSKALVELAERYLTDDDRFVFPNRMKGKTCVIIGRAASELAKLAVCDPDSGNRVRFKGCTEELSDIPCTIPKGRKLRHFGNHRIKDFIPSSKKSS